MAFKVPSKSKDSVTLWFYKKQGRTGPSSQPVLVMPLPHVSEAVWCQHWDMEKPWRRFLCVLVLFVPQGSVYLGSKGMYTTPYRLRPKQRTCCLALPSPYTVRKEEGEKPFHASAFLMGHSSSKRNGYCRWSIGWMFTLCIKFWLCHSLVTWTWMRHWILHSFCLCFPSVKWKHKLCFHTVGVNIIYVGFGQRPYLPGTRLRYSCGYSPCLLASSAFGCRQKAAWGACIPELGNFEKIQAWERHLWLCV